MSSVSRDCYSLNQSECAKYSDYCYWNGQICQENNTNPDDVIINGPYNYTQLDNTFSGNNYIDGYIYYPTNAPIGPYCAVILTPGFGGNSLSMLSWAQFFASYGYIAMIIGPNDVINSSHQDRGQGLIDAISTLQLENNNTNSILYNLVNLSAIAVCGYSMGGGACHNAAMIDSSNISAIISLNPTVLFEDCNLCPEATDNGETYCICLVPELINHSVPSLIFAGEVELSDLPGYDGLLGQDIYANLPAATNKILYEGSNEGHGFVESPNSASITDKCLQFLDFYLNVNNSVCDSLISSPNNASQYLTNITCKNISGDLNNDAQINIQDIVQMVNMILEQKYNISADLNKDGFVNVQDVIALVNQILS